MLTIFTLILTAVFAEKRRNEVMLQDTNDRLQLALDAAELGVWTVDLKSGRFHNDARDRQIHRHDADLPPDWSPKLEPMYIQTIYRRSMPLLPLPDVLAVASKRSIA